MDVLSLREFEGYLVRRDSYVFLDVVWLAEVLKPLFCHKRRELNGKIFLDIGNCPIVLSKRREKQAWKRLEKEGVLEHELSEVLWPEGLSRHVVRALESFGLAFSLPNDDTGSLVLLLRLKKEPPTSVAEDLKRFRSDHCSVLKSVWDMFQGIPPGAIEEVLTRCCSIGPALTFWRFGVLVKGASSEANDTFALLVEYSEDEQKLEMRVYGDLQTVIPWAAASYAMSVMRRMTSEFPGLPWEAFLSCPEHGEGELEVLEEVSGPVVGACDSV